MHFQDLSNGQGPFQDDQMLGELSQLYNTLHEHETWFSSRPKQLKVEAKKMLIKLIPMVNAEAQGDLMESLRTLCNNGINLWQSLRGRKGVWLLTSLLGWLSKQQQQQDESITKLLSILNAEVNASKWAWIIASAGGLPPLANVEIQQSH